MSIRPKRVERLLDHPIAVGLVGRVDGHGQPLRARRLDPLDRHLEGSLRPTRHGHPRPDAREGLRDRGADATAATDHQRHATIEAEHVQSGHRAPSGAPLGSLGARRAAG